MPFCPDCGTEMSEDTRFCPECGHSFMTVGQARNGRNKKKIAGIIGACIVAAILITVLARPPSAIVIETTPLEEGWIRLKIANVGSIDYPSDFLELQSGDYREFVEGLVPVYELYASDFVLQQVGLSELNLSAFEEYRRILFQTVYLSTWEVVSRANEKYTLSQQELTEVHNELVSQLNEAYEVQKEGGLGDNRITDVGSVEIVEVSGMFPMLWTYKRQLDDNPVVLVKNYIFQDYDKIHYLTLSYRVQDADECADIYEKILYSFRLQN